MGKGGGCGQSKVAEGTKGPGPEPVPKSGIDPAVEKMLQATRLSGDAAAVSALSKPGVTLELLERYHRDGVLKAKLQALGVPSDLAIDAIAGTLGKSEAPATTKAPNQTASGAEPPEEGRELAEKVTTTNQRGKMARILSQGMRQVADAVDRKDNLQEDIDVVMENAEPVMEILGESGAVESLSELIRAGQIVDSVKTVLGPVLNVLEGVPYVGAVARLASAILSGVAQAQEVKGACIEFQQLVSNIAPLLVQAREVFQSEDASKKSSAHGILKGLAEVLEEGNELIGIFKQRSWLGRFVRAARDQEDFEALSKRLLAMVQLLTASASVSNAQANKEISARLEEMSKAIEGGGMSMSNFTQAVEAAVEKAGGMQAVIDDPTGDKMREVEKLLPQELQVLVARIDVMERNVAQRIQQAGDAILDILDEVGDRDIDSVLEKNSAMILKQLPEGLRNFWGKDGLNTEDADFFWEDFRDILPFAALPNGEAVEEWYYRDVSNPSMDELLDRRLEPMLTASDPQKKRVLAIDLNRAATVAAMAAGVERPALSLEMLLKQVASPGFAALMGVSGTSETGSVGEGQTICARDIATRLDGVVAPPKPWLSKEVFGWLDQKDAPKVLVLRSLSGMGKTTAAAQLASDMTKSGRLLACYFAGTSDRSSALGLLRSIAVQVREMLPESAESKGLIAAKEEVDGAVIAAGITDALKSVDEPPQTMVILVDGVDEAADGDSNVVMDAMVSHLGTLPSWVRIVLTGTIESFSDDAVAEAGFKLVEPTPEQNLEELKAVIDAVVSTRLTENERSKAMSGLQALSDGSPLYVALLFHMARRNTSFARMKFAELPCGVPALISAYLDNASTAFNAKITSLLKKKALPLLCRAVPPAKAEVEAALDGGPKATQVLARLEGLFTETAEGMVAPVHHSIVAFFKSDNGTQWRVEEEVASPPSH